MGMLFTPDNPLAKRMYDYLEKVWEQKPATVLPREKLIELAKAAGYSRDAAFNALKNLEQVTNVANYWDSTERTVFFAVIPMTAEEKLKRIEDDLWFESLPDTPPPKPETISTKKKAKK